MISNCLIEALKAKIKNPKVVIHTFPAKVNGHKIIPHFWWSLGDIGYDFKNESKTKQVLLFKGKIRSYPKATYEEYVTDLYKKAIAKEFKRIGIKNPFEDLIWHSGRPTGAEAKKYYISFYDDEGKVVVRLVHRDELDRYKIEFWRAGNDDETADLIMNSNFLNEDSVKID